MSNIGKQEKIDLIRSLADNKGIKAYEIAKNIDLTESGVARILNGSTKNPHINTVNSILDFLQKGDKELVLNEPSEHYPSGFPVLNNNNDVSNYIIENTDELLKNKKFATWYNNIILKAQVDMLKEALTKK